MAVSPGQAVVVGRGRRANLVIADDRFISSRHFLVKCDDSGCKLNDLCSTNGTWVNEKKVTESSLMDGDEIVAGRTRIAVSVIDAPADRLPSEPTSEKLRTSKVEAPMVQDEPTSLDLSKTVYDRVTGSGLERLADALEEGEAAKKKQDAS
jgi:pSer/pThr/pTyr-binding forkhead associated (FHA) protein